MGQFVTLASADGRTFDAWLESPAVSNGCGLVVLPEVYNVNAWARRTARRWADAGYTVLVPDLFWRQAPGCHYEYDQPAPARAQGEAVDVAAVVSDIGIAAGWLGRSLGGGTKVGVIGYCLGGRLALLAGVREAVDAVVSYYGVHLDLHLDELARLRKPALLMFGDDDPWVPKEAVEQVCSTLSGHPNVECVVLENAGHGFDRDGQPNFRAAASAEAWRRSCALFDESLR